MPGIDSFSLNEVSINTLSLCGVHSVERISFTDKILE